MPTSIRTSRNIIPVAGIIGAIVLAAGAPAGAAAGRRGSPWGFGIRWEVESRYDDNILGLSETEKDDVDPDDPGSAERFRIESPYDVIFSPMVGLGLSRKPPRGLDTDIGASVDANQYVRNSVKNYVSYSLRVRQDLNRSRAHGTTLTVGGARIPSYFVRPLAKDPNNPVYNSAEFELTRGYVEVAQEIVNRVLSVEARYARERRDYNHHFRERDSSSDVISLEANIYPAGSIGFRVRPYFEHERRDSRGDLASTTVAEDDVGFDSNLYGLELRGLWGRDPAHRNILRGYYQKERRDFESDDPADPTHFGREDDISRFGIGYHRDLGPRWRLGLDAYHRDNDISVSTSKFRKTVAALSLGYAFETGTEAERASPREEN